MIKWEYAFVFYMLKLRWHGKGISFWKDKWDGTSKSQDVYSKLYRIVLDSSSVKMHAMDLEVSFGIQEKAGHIEGIEYIYLIAYQR